MILSPEVASRLAVWRQKAVDNTLTREEMKEAILLLRGNRRSAAVASTASKAKKAKVELPDGDDLLKDLLGDAT